ncbi:S1C family serine protease [Neolewinella persica]|uniref:S1C family serine protease n=1 Tax=Neolewinella persica TaxID=70998 RepID=UPI00036CC4CB|nr:trypsin-like peptidase domain-containing protein [Neolewinella persica]
MNRLLQLVAAALGGGLTAAILVLAVASEWRQPFPAPSPFSTPAVHFAAGFAGQQGPPTPTLAALPRAAVPESLPAPVDLRAAARQAIPTVVHIKASTEGRSREAIKALFSNKSPGRGPQEGEGSGVIYTSNGYVITNLHVVEGAEDITVTTSDRKVFPASLVGQDPKSDLAVLRIEGTDLPYLKLADSDLAEPGSWVLAVGNPLGLTSTVTAGIISAKGRSISLLNDLDAIESFLQTDAAVNPGNSGGPLVTADGKLLGINTAIASKTGRFQGYSFAIPINLVQRIADDIIEFGAYRRAFLGVEISTYTRADRQRLGLTDLTEGVVIDAIFAGGSAEAAGLQIDDLVIRVGKRTIRDLPELTELIGRAKVGEKLNLTVVRNGVELEVIVLMLPEEARD